MREGGDNTGPGEPVRESLGGLFVRFLRFGLLAWGGPAAQIAMIREELVERERWIEASRFNRVLAVYQALPGPEAHELCVYFGCVRRGRLGGLVAGLGFMLPGLVLMLIAAWLYVRFGAAGGVVGAAFAGVQAVVAALIVRAVVRIGGHAVHGRTLWVIAGAACAATLAGVHFGWVLMAAFVAGEVGHRRWWMALPVMAGVALAWWFGADAADPADASVMATGGASAGVLEAGWVGLQAGSLTFGGAYTVVPFLVDEAVASRGWLTESAFLDGVGIGGVLPAPMVIVATFVGFAAGGLPAALAMTAGVFLPAFAFTLIGHGVVERVVDTPWVHRGLDGVTAGVVGIIAATAAALLPGALESGWTAAVFLAGLLALFRFRSKYAVPAVVLGAAAVGAVVFGLSGVRGAGG